MNIRRRLWLLFVVTLMLLTLVGSYTVSVYRDGLARAATEAEAGKDIADALHHVGLTLQAGSALARLLSSMDATGPTAKAIAEFNALHRHNQAHLSRLGTQDADDPEVTRALADFKQAYQRLVAMMRAAETGDPSAMAQAQQLSELTDKRFAEVAALAQARDALRQEKLAAALRTDERHLLLLLMVGSMVTLGLFWLLDRNIGRPAEQATLLANYDPLTGLPNRTLFQDRLNHAISRATRTDSSLALLFFDLDHFKSVNDALGHHMGDNLLQQVGERLRQCLRDSDTPARLGGDEFAVIVERFTDENGIVQVAQKIIDAMQQPFSIGKQNAYVSASLGITRYPQDASGAAELLKNADAAMYLAKRRGRGRYHFFTEELNQAARQRLMLESQLRTGLELGHFSLHYQPQICLRNGNLIGAEALLRFKPHDRFIPPDIFIPVLEETGLILSVGRWVLEQACTYAALLRERHERDLRMAVNLSARQLQQPAFVQDVARILNETGLPAHCLEAEITERNLIDAHDGDDTLPNLRKLGVRLAIDDFGTGYSSLSYLKRFAVDLLKIDKSFIHDITQDKDDDAVTTAIIALSHELDIEVIAEGVETTEQQAFLLQNRCDCAQGYLFSRPLPADDFNHWIERRYRLIDDFRLDGPRP